MRLTSLQLIFNFTLLCALTVWAAPVVEFKPSGGNSLWPTPNTTPADYAAVWRTVFDDAERFLNSEAGVDDKWAVQNDIKTFLDIAQEASQLKQMTPTFPSYDASTWKVGSTWTIDHIAQFRTLQLLYLDSIIEKLRTTLAHAQVGGLSNPHLWGGEAEQ